MRSKPGAVTSFPSRMTPPAEGCSNPAMMLSNVLLPHSECPISVTNSPLSMRKSTSQKTQKPSCRPVRPVVPSCRGKYLLTRSMLRNVIALLRVRAPACEAIEAAIEANPHGANDQHGKHDASDVQIVPFDPRQV